MTVVDELVDLVRTTSGAAAPAVVAIGSRGRGTGFVVAPGRVLTNAHNLRDRTTQVTFADGRSVQATVVGSDVDGDLIVLEVDTAGVTPLAWRKSMGDGYGLPSSCQPDIACVPRVRAVRLTGPLLSVPVRSTTWLALRSTV